MILRNPYIRPADKDDVEAITEILKENEFYIHGVDWSDLGSTWLVAQHKGRVIGCIQVAFAKPIGYLNFWAVKKEYVNSGAGIALWRNAERLLAQTGTDAFMAISVNSQVCDRIKNGLGAVIGTYDVFVKRIWRGKLHGPKGTENFNSATTTT